MTIYLDCNATTPIDPDVADVVRYYMEKEFANSESRTHIFGNSAKKAVEHARSQIADVINVDKNEVIFTSGATESNNLAILGLMESLQESGKTHIITTAIEHKSVIEPIKVLEKNGFHLTFLKPQGNGIVSIESLSEAITKDTGLVSVMHVNNETGSIQPIDDIAYLLKTTDIFFHVDAAQGFAKDLEPLTNSRIDLISFSGHKIYGPKGVGALVLRRRNYKRPPIKPLIYGGGQEGGLRPGTLPVPMIAGVGKAAELLSSNNFTWRNSCQQQKDACLLALKSLNPVIHGENTLPNVINFSVPGINSETAILTLKDVIAFSNGSACTSKSYEISHVLKAMGIEDEIANSSMRISWCHMTEHIPWEVIIYKLRALLS